MAALSLDVVKVLILCGLLVMTFIFGMLPVIFIRYIEKASASHPKAIEDEHRRKKKFSNYWRLLSFLNCFAAGVFLATCMLELLPSVRHNLIRAMFASKVYTGFPLAEFVMVVGLFFILIIEQIALNVKENSAPPSANPKSDNSSDIHQPLLASSHHDNDTDEEGEDERIASIRDDHFLGGLSDQPRVIRKSGAGVSAVEDDTVEQNVTVPSARHATNSRSTLFHSNSDLNSGDNLASSQMLSSNSMERNIHVHSVFRSMFLLCALSLHAIFEGLTVGLQSKISNTIDIFVALVVHKSILSFSLGMNLMQSKISVKSAIRSIVLFSVAAPVGVLVGMAIMDLWNSTKSAVVHGVLQGFASGTFLYIIFFEILPKEFNSQTDRLLKVLFLIIGYAVITGIMFLGDDVKHPFCLMNGYDSPTP